MTDRERITEILKAYTKKHNISASSVILEEYAEELVANGVIVPPCKVGDIIWVDDFMWGLIPCKVDEPYHFVCGDGRSCTVSGCFTDKDIGKWVFLTKEEAEQALKEKENG